jgi:2-polyprenyl-3-methyl-5-hydroxy-6-metoxy-1,4-benzoquinol methylase
MAYEPREFWQQRLSEHFDLRGTGESGLSLAFNRACYALRQEVLERALREADAGLEGRTVLDVGCGTGFFTAYYLGRGARVTGLDIAPVAVERLAARHPDARFLLADVSEAALAERFDVVNAFDVLYHITDDARWERAVRNLAAAVAPGGLLLVTDTFAALGGLAAHNQSRPLARYQALLSGAGLVAGALYPTHVLLNRELGAFRFLNRAPGLLLLADRALLALGAGRADPVVSKLLVARRRP